MMNRFRIVLVALTLWCALSPAVLADEFAFVGVDVIDVAAGGVVPNQTVTVSGGRIAEIGPSDAISLLASVHRIDGRGKYLAPGLMDMHTHVSKQDQLIVNMAFGVTTIRVMWGNPETLKLRQALEENRIPGPRIVAAGMLLDGHPPYWPGSTELTDPSLAEEIVAGQKRDGYDFVKVYSRLTPEVFDAILAAARKYGIEASGHIPQSVPFQHALDSGMKTSEHFTGVLAAVLTDSSLPNPDVSPFFANAKDLMERIGRGEIDPATLIDTAKVTTLAKYAAAQNHWFVPTHHIMRNFTNNPLPAFEKGLSYLTPEEKVIVLGDVGEFFSLTADQKTGESIMYQFRTDVLRAFYEAGAKIMVGTDQQTMVGLATIAEMQALHDAGIAVADVLRAATMVPANYLGRSGELGEVAEGAVADLILIGGNPLEDLSALEQLDGVMTRGIWRDRAALDELLAGVAARAAAAGE